MWLTLKVFGAIMSGEAHFLVWDFKRSEGERKFAVWMALGAFLSLILYFAALKAYLGSLSWF
jgi:hypothetical protein